MKNYGTKYTSNNGHYKKYNESINEDFFDANDKIIKNELYILTTKVSNYITKILRAIGF